MRTVFTGTLRDSCRAAAALFILAGSGAFLFDFMNAAEFTVMPYREETYRVIESEVDAGAAIIYDIHSGDIIAGKNPTDLKSIASVTKLTAALVAVSHLEGDDSTVIDSSDISLTANTPLRLGDRWRTFDLLEYSLITSSNRGINAVGRTVADKAGKSIVDLMNRFAHANGLVQTHFLNPTGLDAHDALSGSESCALDLAKIAAIIVNTQSRLAELTTRKEATFYSMDDARYDAVNTNILLGEISERVLLSKTGYTDIAGGTLVMVVEDGKRRIALVVLDSTRTGRFEDMRTLLSIWKEESASPVFSGL